MAIRKKPVLILAAVILALILGVSAPVRADNFTTWTALNSGTTNNLFSVWGGGSSVFALGSAGTILQYNGSAWRSMSSGLTVDLYGVWGSGVSDVFAVGKSGTILHYNGSDWSPMTSGVKADLHGLWGTGSQAVFAVGKTGLILHYDGADWISMVSGTTNDLLAVWGTGGKDVFAAGGSGTIIHYDGEAWSPMTSGTTNDLQGLWGAGSGDVWAVGRTGTIRHYDGTAWSLKISGAAGDLYGIWGANNKNIFLTGESGSILFYDGAKFVAMNRNTINDLRAIWGFSATDVFTVGGAGTVLRYLPPAVNVLSRDGGDQGEIIDVNLDGSNLAGASEVRFGTGIAVNSFSVLSSNRITVNITIVAGAQPGVRDVSITTPGGSFTLPASFSVVQSLPTLSAVSPDQERQGATLNVTISGTNLSGASEVRFGAGIAVNNFSVLSSNQIAVNLSLAADAVTGTREVSVVTPRGSIALPSAFNVKQALPVISAINPDLGNQETALSLTIDGQNLTGAQELLLGRGIRVNNFTVLSSNQIAADITITAGAESGTRDISVVTPGGSFVLPNSFKVIQALPVIKTISPAQGSQGATLGVLIQGANFSGANELRLGPSVAVNSFTVIDRNQISANITILTGAETGLRDVSVNTTGGSHTLAKSFMVTQGLPIITSINPGHGSQGATLTLIISGRNLDDARQVSFGPGVAVQTFTNLSPIQISVNVVIGEDAVTGLRGVTVTTPGGSSTLANSFSVQESSTGTLVIALIWVGIGLVVILFALVLKLLRKKRSALDYFMRS